MSTSRHRVSLVPGLGLDKERGGRELVCVVDSMTCTVMSLEVDFGVASHDNTQVTCLCLGLCLLMWQAFTLNGTGVIALGCNLSAATLHCVHSNPENYDALAKVARAHMWRIDMTEGLLQPIKFGTNTTIRERYSRQKPSIDNICK